MRIIDADILSYALFEGSPAHTDSWKMIEQAAKGKIELYVALTSLLETYNVLYWFYKIRPRTALLQKLSLAVTAMRTLAPSPEALDLASRENLPLGDGFLLATALRDRIPIVVSNDGHVAKAAPKLGLIVENPLSQKTRRLLRGPRDLEAES